MPSPTQYRARQYRTQGLEFGLNNAYNHLKSSIAFAYIGRSNDLNDSIFNSQMTYSPEIRLNLLYEFKKLEGNISLNYKYNGELPYYAIDEIGNVIETRTDDYNILNIIGTKYLMKRILDNSMSVSSLGKSKWH